MTLKEEIITEARQKHKVEAFCKTGTDESWYTAGNYDMVWQADPSLT